MAKRTRLQPRDKIYNRSLFGSTSMREGISDNYFAATDNAEDAAMMPYLEHMKNRSRKCPYWRLLKHYCPCSVDSIKNKASKKCKFPKPSQKNLIADHCSIKSVHSFVCAVLRRLVPLDFFGSFINRKVFFKNILGLLSVQKYGQISLIHLIRDIKLSKMSCLQSLKHSEQQEKLLVFVDFLVSKVICPLLQSFFCFVESSYAKIKLFIYRKRVWHRLHHKAFFAFSKFCKLSFITEQRFRDLIKEKKCLGGAKISFILKKSSLRPISNSSLKDNGRASINSHLISLLIVLRYERERNPSSFGVTAIGKLDFQKKFRDYILKFKRSDSKRLYFVTADIERCFDQIDCNLLFDIGVKMIKSDAYVIHSYKKRVTDRISKKECFKYFQSVHCPKYIDRLNNNVEYIGMNVIRKNTLVQQLEALLLNNVIKMGKNHYRQKKGISQGSKLSSILCAAYLSWIEEKIYSKCGFTDFFVRVADEYLFASTTKSSAKFHLKCLIEGMQQFGCNINMNKCQVNFNFGDGQIQRSTYIKFFGLCIDPAKVMVSSDYSSYMGLKAKDVVTVTLTKNPGKTLKERVLRSLCPKSDAILFDNYINTNLVIKKNVLQIFCMTAVKFDFLISRLPSKDGVDKNPSFFLDIILSLPPFLHQHISCSLEELSTPTSNYKSGVHPLSIETMRSLCNNAFLYLLQKNDDMYSKIIIKIKDIEKNSVVFPTVEKGVVKQAFKDIFLK